MKRVGLCVWAASAAMLGSGAPRAETEAEYLHPSRATAARPRAAEATPATTTALPPAAGESAAKPRALSRQPLFAAAAAANAKRMPAQQREERWFLREAAATNRFQGDAARLALVKSDAPGVRSLAEALIRDRNANGNDLLWLLHRRGMAAPMLANHQRRTLNRLAKLQGARFDREFMMQVGLKSQQDEVLFYEKAAAMPGDPALKSWIGRTLPALRQQLATAERVAAADVKPARNLRSAGAAPQSSRAAVATRAPTDRNPAAPGQVTQTMGAESAAAGVRRVDGSRGSAPQPGAVQPGSARSIATRPSESNSR